MLSDALEQMPWLLAELAITERCEDRVSRGLRSGQAITTPVPYNIEAAAVRAALGNAITGWVRHMCESRGIEPTPIDYLPATFVGPTRPAGPRRVPDGYVISAVGAARWLAAHAVSVRLDEAAGEIYRDIVNGLENGLAVVNPAPGAIYRGPCPSIIGVGPAGQPTECATPLYAAGRDERYVTCTRCAGRVDTGRLEQRLLARVGGHLYALPDLLRVLTELGEPVPRGTIASWISRGQLLPRAWRTGDRVTVEPADPAARPMYGIDEVRKLRRTAPRAGGSTA